MDVSQIRAIHKELPNYFDIENRKQKLREELSNIELEYRHFLSENSDTDFSLIKYRPDLVASQKVMEIIVGLNEKNRTISFWKKLLIRNKLKINS